MFDMRFLFVPDEDILFFQPLGVGGCRTESPRTAGLDSVSPTQHVLGRLVMIATGWYASSFVSLLFSWYRQFKFLFYKRVTQSKSKHSPFQDCLCTVHLCCCCCCCCSHISITVFTLCLPNWLQIFAAKINPLADLMKLWLKFSLATRFTCF